MTRVMKPLTIALGVVLVVFAALGLLMSHAFHVESSVHVDKPSDAVFARVSSLRAWSGWLAWDTTGGVEYGGDDGKAGSYVRFPSGTLELVDVKPGAIVYRERLGRPPIDDHGVIEIQPDVDAKGTTITWRIDGTIDTLFGGWSRFLLERRAQKHFDDALAQLKSSL